MHKIAGGLLFLAGAVMWMGITTAEIFYPVNYSISQNMISNLGSTRPPNSVIYQPSASIFDGTMIVAGVLVLASVLFLNKVFPKNAFNLAMMGLGVGAAGVGIFPAFHADLHPVSALVAFLAGGASALLSSRVTKPPFSYFAVLFGLISLSFLFLGVVLPQTVVPLLGVGGAERWVAYPMTLWLTGFGGYLMSLESIKSKKRS